MAGSVIQRLFDRSDRRPHDAPATWEAAEALAGRRLDRRRCYAIIKGELCETVTWSAPCSGCTEAEEMVAPPKRGSGCDECGYTGRRKHAQWVPYLPPEACAA